MNRGGSLNKAVILLSHTTPPLYWGLLLVVEESRELGCIGCMSRMKGLGRSTSLKEIEGGGGGPSFAT